VLAVKVLGVNRADLEGARDMLKPLRESFPTIKLRMAVIAILGARITRLVAHAPEMDHARSVRGLSVPKRGLLVPMGTEVEWDKLFPPGFQPQPKRWIIERTFAWITRWRRLACDHEGVP
jgi:hypothetical protein